MPTTFSFEISGLCLLVPRTANDELWVLMPQTRRPHLHVAAIVWTDANGNQQVRAIDGASVEIAGTGAGSVRSALAGLHGHQRSIHGKAVPTGWFTGARPADVTARVRIQGATSLVPSGGRPKWKYGSGASREMHTTARCILQVPGASIDVMIDGAALTIPVRPGQVAFCIVHVPPGEHPSSGCPQRGNPPHHWYFFRELLGVPLGDTRQPELDEDCRQAAAQTDDRQTHAHAHVNPQHVLRPEDVRGVSPYSCMMVPGCAEDDPSCPP